MKVLDGNEVTLTCTYSIQQPKYSAKCDMLNRSNTICIGHQLEDFLELKNQSKQTIVLHIEGQGIQISDKLKLAPEQNKKIKVKFVSK